MCNKLQRGRKTSPELYLKLSGRNIQEVEAAISLLYEAGEGANEEMIKPGCGYLGQLALGIHHLQIARSDVLLA